MPTVAEEQTPKTGDISFYFLHGWGASPDIYRDSLEVVERLGVSVVAPPIPGHSDAPNLPKGERRLIHVAKYLEEQIECIDPESHLVLAGHSLGGALATLMCQSLIEKHADISLLLLSPAGANPIFGPREWARALTDLRQDRPLATNRMKNRHAIRNFLRNSVRSRRLGWEARNMDLTHAWSRLASNGVPITAIHASNDRVVDTQPLLYIEGVRSASIPRTHDWPVWDSEAFVFSADLHLETVAEKTSAASS